MALDPREILNRSSAHDRVAPAPLAGTRAQRVQRVQIGLFGLGAMVMMVGLANIIISGAQENQGGATEDLAPVSADDIAPPPGDPLADAGVVPDLPAEPVAEETQPADLTPGLLPDIDVVEELLPDAE